MKEIPFVNKESMKVLATSIWALYQNAIQRPEISSTSQGTNEVIYAYYDKNHAGKLDKVNPTSGSKYSIVDTAELQKNNRLLFNSTFDVEGNLIIPNKVIVISNRWSKDHDYGTEIGLLAFELNITDSVKQELNKVKLRTTAKTDINSLTGDLSPVAVKIPFNITTKKAEKVERIYGKVVKNKDYFQFSFTEAWYATDNDGSQTSSRQETIAEDTKSQVIEFIKARSELPEYKNGTFDFVVEKRTAYTSFAIDENIFRDNMVWSSEENTQATNAIIPTSTPEYKVLKFEGKGKK